MKKLFELGGHLHLAKHMAELRKPRAMPSLSQLHFIRAERSPPRSPAEPPSVPEGSTDGDNMSPRWNAPRSQWLFNLTHAPLLKGKGQRGTKWCYFFVVELFRWKLIYRWGAWHVLAEDNVVFSLATSACRSKRGRRLADVYGMQPPLPFLWPRDKEKCTYTVIHIVHKHGTLHYKQVHWNQSLYVILGLQTQEGLYLYRAVH